MVRPRRAYQNPVWSAIHITQAFVIAPLAGYVIALLIWG